MDWKLLLLVIAFGIPGIAACIGLLVIVWCSTVMALDKARRHTAENKEGE